MATGALDELQRLIVRSAEVFSRRQDTKEMRTWFRGRFSCQLERWAEVWPRAEQERAIGIVIHQVLMDAASRSQGGPQSLALHGIVVSVLQDHQDRIG